MTELQPQWLTNPPILECSRIIPCGAHPSTNFPRSPTLSRYPAGRASSIALGFSPASAAGNLITHRKFTLLSSNPRATSSISSSVRKYSVPNETNTVEHRGFMSSHSLISGFSPSATGDLTSGPTGVHEVQKPRLRHVQGLLESGHEVGREAIGGVIHRRGTNVDVEVPLRERLG
nr:Os06g0343500 protein [Ipomoea batatas]